MNNGEKCMESKKGLQSSTDLLSCLGPTIVQASQSLVQVQLCRLRYTVQCALRKIDRQDTCCALCLENCTAAVIFPTTKWRKKITE